MLARHLQVFSRSLFFPRSKKDDWNSFTFFLESKTKKGIFFHQCWLSVWIRSQTHVTKPETSANCYDVTSMFFCSETTFLFVSSAIKADCNENVWSDKTSPTKCIFKTKDFLERVKIIWPLTLIYLNTLSLNLKIIFCYLLIIPPYLS